ncbi:type II toxin-antitoxin system VapB family antitoxin [Nocardioides sp. LHD-245]|uniref:type II toxin-antitoxin system VapB family antitoxin n=1 Tax=Nocardioides sp. LHD-245 TaxID=3051387 RepID=UPI0027DFFCBA|nr:type II toxin-antitoxin system VapB family antitoxin [Nocardioides sp. LHD-245]
MSLNIKNPRVHELAREAARLTGKSQTSVIEEALVKLLADYGADPVEAERRRRIDAVNRIALRWRDLPEIEGEDRIRDVEDLYDPETGLPA